METTSSEILTDNYVSENKKLYKFILEYCSFGMSQRHEEELKYALERSASHPEDVFMEHVTVEYFSKAPAEDMVRVPMYIEFKRPHRADTAFFADAEGNIWCKYKITARINWSTYGSITWQNALIALDVMNRVAGFCKLIEETFTEDVYVLRSTKEQVAERKEADEKRSSMIRLQNFVEDTLYRKNMRVDSKRWIPNNDTSKLPLGRHEVKTRDGKLYSMRIAAGGIDIRRIN